MDDMDELTIYLLPEGYLFTPGRVVATPGALELADKVDFDVFILLSRHLTGDWGDMDDEDKMLNNQAVYEDGRILSSYNTPGGKLWIITEADRSATTFLLPSEY